MSYRFPYRAIQEHEKVESFPKVATEEKGARINVLQLPLSTKPRRLIRAAFSYNDQKLFGEKGDDYVRLRIPPEEPTRLQYDCAGAEIISGFLYNAECIVTGYWIMGSIAIETTDNLFIGALFTEGESNAARGIIKYDKGSTTITDVTLQTISAVQNRNFAPSIYTASNKVITLLAAWNSQFETIEANEYISMWVTSSAEDITTFGIEQQILMTETTGVICAFPSIVVTPSRSMVFCMLQSPAPSTDKDWGFKIASVYPFVLADLSSTRLFIDLSRFHYIQARQDTVSPDIVHFFSRDHSSDFQTDGRGYYFWADFQSGKFKGVLPEIGDMTDGSLLPMEPFSDTGNFPNGSPRNDAGFEWFPIETTDWVFVAKPLARGELGRDKPVFVPLVERDGISFQLKVLRLGRDFYSVNLNAADKQYVDLTTLGAFGAGMHNYTWSVWFKTTTLTRMSFAATYNDGSTTNFASMLNLDFNEEEFAGSIYHQIRNDSGVARTTATHTRTQASSGDDYSTGDWHKLTMRVTAGEAQFWLNNQEITGLSVSGSTPADNFSNLQYALLLGGFNNQGTINQDFWNGKFAFPALYSTAKSRSYIEDDWQRIPDPADPDLFAAWFFKEGSGSTVADEEGNHDGTLQPGSGTIAGMWDEDIPPVIDSEKIDLGVSLDDFNIESIQNTAGTEFKIIFVEGGVIKQLVTTDDFATWSITDVKSDSPVSQAFISPEDHTSFPILRHHGLLSSDTFCLELESIDLS